MISKQQNHNNAQSAGNNLYSFNRLVRMKKDLALAIKYHFMPQRIVIIEHKKIFPTEWINNTIQTLSCYDKKEIAKFLSKLSELFLNSNYIIFNPLTVKRLMSIWRSKKDIFDLLNYYIEGDEDVIISDDILNILLDILELKENKNENFFQIYLLKNIIPYKVLKGITTNDLNIVFRILHSIKENDMIKFLSSIFSMTIITRSFIEEVMKKHSFLFYATNKIRKLTGSDSGRNILMYLYIVESLFVQYSDIFELHYIIHSGNFVFENKSCTNSFFIILEKNVGIVNISFEKKDVIANLFKLYIARPSLFEKRNLYKKNNNIENHDQFSIEDFCSYFLQNYEESKISDKKYSYVNKKLTIDFLKELFKKFKIPQYFILNFYQLDNFDIQFMLHVTRGDNLTTAPNLPFKLTRKAAHIFTELNAMTETEGISLKEILLKCHLISIGAKKDEVIRCLINNVMRKNDDYNINPFWIEFIGFIVRNYTEEICVKSLDTIFEYVHTRVFEEKKEMVLKGRSLKKLEHKALIWYEQKELEKNKIKYNKTDFSRSEINDFYYKGKYGEFLIRQLLYKSELYAEGQKQRNCVYNYVDKCASDEYQIFSLRTKDKKGLYNYSLVTIQVKDRTIIQAKGKCNREITPNELEVIKTWCSKEKLKISI